MNAIVKAKGLNLRAQANSSATILEVLKEGQELLLLSGDTAGWTKVARGNVKGYVATRYIEVVHTKGLSKSKRDIKYLVVHCTAGWQTESTADLLAHFRKLGWKNNGYHFIVNADGTVEQITDLDDIANGVAGYNSNCIHISYKGGIEKVAGKIVGVDNRTPEQKTAIINLLKELKELHPKAVIKGHRDFSPDKNKNGKIEPNEYIKLCPGYNAIPEYSFIK